jgi:hypothetical protein
MSKWDDGAFYHYQMPTVEINILWDGCKLVVFRLPEYLYICSIVYMEYSICRYLRCMPLWLFTLPRVLYVTLLLYSTFLWIVRFMYVNVNGSSIANVGEKSVSKWDGAFYCYQIPTVEIHIWWDGARLVCCFPIAQIITYLQYCYGIFNWIIPLLCVLHVILLLYSMFLLGFGMLMSMGQA